MWTGDFVLRGGMGLGREEEAVVSPLRKVCSRGQFDALSKFRKVARESWCRRLACIDGKSVVMVGWVSRSMMVSVCVVVGDSTVGALYLDGYM